MPKPFIKWAGGKTYLLPVIKDIFDSTKINLAKLVYCEPMVGGGAVLFSESGRFKTKVINDVNKDLINIYITIRDDVDGLIKELKNTKYSFVHKSHKPSIDNYHNIRSSTPATDTEKAARMIFLLKTCFNGLMRQNKSGGFNTPAGSYRNPKILDEEALRDVSKFLTKVKITNHDVIKYLSLISKISSRCFLFMDPPYHSENGAAFTDYSGNFGDEEQKRLAEALLASGCRFIYTNRSTKLTNNLFINHKVNILRIPLKHSIQPKYTTGVVGEEIIVHNL